MPQPPLDSLFREVGWLPGGAAVPVSGRTKLGEKKANVKQGFLFSCLFR
jgi:hypothetical protein